MNTVSQIVQRIESICGTRPMVLVAIDGLGGAGKSTLSSELATRLRRSGRHVQVVHFGVLYFGEAANTPLGERVRRIQALLDQAGIAHQTPPDMMRMLWWKFMVNVGVNQASAVMRASYGTFKRSPEAQALMEALMRETVDLARAEGVDLSAKDVHDWYAVMNGLSPDGKTSMLQDIEAGRKTEVEMFAGKVVELGAKHGIPTPVNQTVLQIIHVLETQAGSSNER